MFDSAELGRKVDKATFGEREPTLREELLELQFRLRAAQTSVVVIVAGPEASGRSETVNLLLEWLDVRGIETHAARHATDDEGQRPEFFRFWRRLPAHGRIAIFFGSWYTEPILRHARGAIDDARLDQSLRRTVAFERMLAGEGVQLVKLWLHITKKEQRKRFKKFEADPETAWRITKDDWKAHEGYDALYQTASHVVRRTSRSFARWHVIEAADRRYRHLTVGETLASALAEKLDVPAASPWTSESVPPPEEVNLIRALDLTQTIADDEYERRKRSAQQRIGRAVRRMAELERSVVLVFEGSDAAGKGGAIRRAMQGIDARSFRVIPIGAPTDEERARPYLWRFWRHLPRHGHVTVFDRSWYGRVLVERVEGLCAPEDWRRAFAEINEFEEQLTDADVILCKFWLSISSTEQLRRFEQRESTGHKRHKITDEDWRNRAKWDDYESAACEAIERTSSTLAPWTLVAAEDKRFARVKVLETILERLGEER